MNILVPGLIVIACAAVIIVLCFIVAAAQAAACSQCPYKDECDLNSKNEKFVPRCEKHRIMMNDNNNML